jgi:hypothetical protein
MVNNYMTIKFPLARKDEEGVGEWERGRAFKGRFLQITFIFHL